MAVKVGINGFGALAEMCRTHLETVKSTSWRSTILLIRRPLRLLYDLILGSSAEITRTDTTITVAGDTFRVAEGSGTDSVGKVGPK
jgi:hypothetical protein